MQRWLLVVGLVLVAVWTTVGERHSLFVVYSSPDSFVACGSDLEGIASKLCGQFNRCVVRKG